MMTPIVLSALLFATPVAIGFVVMIWLREATRRILIDLCRTEDRARFWMRCTAVVMVSAPLVLVLIAAGNPLECAAASFGCVLHLLRQTLGWSVVGILMAVGAIAYGVTRHIPREVETGAAAGSAS
jgi:hypothetical protein